MCFNNIISERPSQCFYNLQPTEETQDAVAWTKQSLRCQTYNKTANLLLIETLSKQVQINKIVTETNLSNHYSFNLNI